MNKINNKEFCDLYNAFYGQDMSDTKQLTHTWCSGQELKEFIEFVLESKEVPTPLPPARVEPDIRNGESIDLSIVFKNIFAGVGIVWMLLFIYSKMVGY